MVLSSECPLSNLAGSMPEVIRTGPCLGCTVRDTVPLVSARLNVGSQSAASQPRAGWPGALSACRYRSQAATLPLEPFQLPAHPSLLKSPASTLPSHYKKHSLTFVFPYLFLIRVFLLIASASATMSQPAARHRAVDCSQHHL